MLSLAPWLSRPLYTIIITAAVAAVAVVIIIAVIIIIAALATAVIIYIDYRSCLLSVGVYFSVIISILLYNVAANK